MAKLETLKLGSLSLNGGSKLAIQELTFKPAEPKPQWATNSNASGDALIEEPNYTNAIFELQVRVRQTSTADAALVVIGEVMDALQSCARLVPTGQEVTWTPSESTHTYTAYALLGELVEVPITQSGDLEGWFIRSPVLKIKLVCRPFLYGTETTLFAVEGGAEPFDVRVAKCGGDVPAEATIILGDKSSQDRRHFKYGQAMTDSKGTVLPIVITAASLVTTGFSGEAKTRSGAWLEEKVKRATLVSQATTICGTGPIKHVGSYRIFARVYAADANARFCISYRSGDGPLTRLEFVAPPVIGNFSTIDLGEVSFAAVSAGEQRSEIRVEAKTAGATAIEVDLNYLELIPTSRGYGKARGMASNNPTKLEAYDTFLQTEGALAGKALPIGGTWAGAGDADDFKVIAVDDVARRTATSDAGLETGRYAIAGTTSYVTCQVSTSISCNKTGLELKAETFRFGVFARYTAEGETPKTWVMAAVENDTRYDGQYLLTITKHSGGFSTVLGSVSTGLIEGAPTNVGLEVEANGTWHAWAVSVGGVVTTTLSGQDSALASGGALESGKVGIYDAWTTATACSRDFDDFTVVGVEPAGRVCYSGRTCRLTSDGFSRQDSTGAYEDGRPSLYRGANLYLWPEGAAGEQNVLVTGMRRNDIDTEADTNVTDKYTIEVKARERFLTPR